MCQQQVLRTALEAEQSVLPDTELKLRAESGLGWGQPNEGLERCLKHSQTSETRQMLLLSSSVRLLTWSNSSESHARRHIPFSYRC